MIRFLLRGLWFAVGACVTIRFGYDAVMYFGACLDMCPPPQVSALWTALAFTGAFCFSLEVRKEEIKNLLKLGD